MTTLEYTWAGLALWPFLFLLLAGRAFFALAGVRMKGVAAWYLSPAMGLVVAGFLVGWLNQAGLPVRAFGQELTIALTVVSLGIIVWKKCSPPRALLASGALAVIYLGTVGWPLLLQGPDWISFLNHDFSNYTLAATRLLSHGFFDVPTREQLQGGDPATLTWFMHVSKGERPCTDTMLAAMADTFRISPREIFMPFTLSLHLVQAWALAGLLALESRTRRAALPAMVVLLFTPLSILEVYYQLIAQAGGLALMLLAYALLVRPMAFRPWPGNIRQALPCAAAMAYLLWFYPEATPFTLMGAALFHAWALWKHASDRWRRLAWLTVAGCTTLLLLHINLQRVFGFLLNQIRHGAQQADRFPYFVELQGWPRLMGWTEFYGQAPAWTIWVAVAAVVACIVALLRKSRLVPPLASAMALVIALLVMRQSGFGVFKAALFAQTVLAAGAGTAWCWTLRWPVMVRAVIVLVWMASVAPTALAYRRVSLGEPGGPCEAPYASQLGFPRRIPLKGECQVINMGPGMEKVVLQNLKKMRLNPLPPAASSMYWLPREYHLELATSLMEHIKSETREFESRYVYLEPPLVPGRSSDRYLAEPHPLLCPFNRLDARTQFRDWYTFRPLGEFRNRLSLLPSEESQAPIPAAAAREYHFRGFPIESDPAASPGERRTFMNMRRHLLFEVLRPTEEMFVRIQLTRTYRGEGRTALPEKAVILGDGEWPVGFTGNGTACVVVGPVRPRMSFGRALLALDLGEQASQLPVGDTRPLGGWIRDVSALTPGRRGALAPPASISQFPRDLLDNPGLEYSGIFEDGWIGRDSWVTLRLPEGDRMALQLKLQIPGIGKLAAGNRVRVKLDGAERLARTLPAGEFETLVELPRPASDRVRVEISWDHTENLPKRDARPVAARVDTLRLISIE